MGMKRCIQCEERNIVCVYKDGNWPCVDCRRNGLKCLVSVGNIVPDLHLAPASVVEFLDKCPEPAPVKKCTNCVQRGTVCEFRGSWTCLSCQSFKDKCAIPDFTDEQLAAKLKLAASAVPATEAEKQTELKQLRNQAYCLNWKIKGMLVADVKAVLNGIVEEYWKWLIFFWPVFGMLTPVLLLGLGLLLADTLQPSKQRLELQEMLNKVTARRVLLKNTKVPTKELSCLEFVGVIALFLGGTVMFLAILGSAAAMTGGKR